jgi:type IV secretion system protein TrbL
MQTAVPTHRVLFIAAVGTAAASAFLLLAPPPAQAIDGCGVNPFCIIGKGAGHGISALAGDAITSLAKAVLGALSHAIAWAATLWTGVGVPYSDIATGGQPAGTVADLQTNLLPYTGALAVLSTLLGAARIVYIEHKASAIRELLTFFARYVLVSGAAAGAAVVLVSGCDEIAASFISSATGSTGFANQLAGYLGLVGSAGGGAGFTTGLAGTADTAVIAILLGILAFLASIVQIVLMLVRGAMLILLIGVLPLIAAFSNTEMGNQWFRKAAAWILAFALYKPAAAVIYAAAFNLQTQPGALSLLDGTMMLFLAILALPALLRFLVPATSAIAGGSGAGALAAAGIGAASARMPTGAAAVSQDASHSQGQASMAGGGTAGRGSAPTGAKNTAEASTAAEGAGAGAAAGPVGAAVGGAVEAASAAKGAADKAVSDSSEDG